MRGAAHHTAAVCRRTAHSQPGCLIMSGLSRMAMAQRRLGVKIKPH
jgi:hypothetical protein